jgi:hypothetical protein
MGISIQILFYTLFHSGSISYLVTPETSHTKTWTHILMAQEGKISSHSTREKRVQQLKNILKQVSFFYIA